MKEKLSYIFVIILMIGAIFQVNSTVSISVVPVDLEPISHQPPIYESVYKFKNDLLSSGKSDFGFLGVTYTGWNPPDPIIAAGPEHLVVMTNGAIAFFQKNGTKDFQDEIGYSDGFWGEQGAIDIAFDPEVIYDPHTDRFMAMACERDGFSSKSFFLLAISDDSNPNGDWYKYRIDVTTEGGGPDIDSPNIAVDSEAVYLTADFFTDGQKYLVYILEKNPLLSGSIGNTKSMLINGLRSFGIPVSYGNPPAMYMIEHFEATTNTIVRLHAITDPLGTPQRVTYNLTVPAYSPPEDPPQKGTSTRIETFDSRFWSCIWRNGSLWATHHQGSSRVMARWYEIKTNDWPKSGNPTLYQSGDIDPGPEIRTFFTAIAPDGYGNAAMCFARSSPDEYISMARCMRSVDDPIGTMGDVVIVKESSYHYDFYRWGDYSGVSCDPSDDCTFWMHGEYTPGGNIWNTWISKCKIQNNPPDTPNIYGPISGGVETEYEYTFVTTDSDADDVYYYIDWGNGDIEEWIGPYSSGEEIIIGYTWSESGNYTIRVKAKDIFDAESVWSEPLNVTISNLPKSPVIDGPQRGKAGKEYTFTFNSEDPEDDDVYYYIKWGDGHFEIWDGPHTSGVDFNIPHTYTREDTFTIEAKAKDVNGAESNWSYFEIKISRTRATTNIVWYQWFLERFPMLEKLLNSIYNNYN